jgi:multiple sugar transport system substrate-binding protein
MFPNGGRIFDDMNNPTKAVFNTPENIRALGIMQDLIFKYNGAPKQSDQEILGGGFDNGKIAMDITGVWAIVFRKDIKDFKWDIAHLPKAEGQERIVPALYAGYAVNKSTKNPELAWEFAKFMQSDEAQKLLASSGLITVINKKIATSDEVIKVPGAPDNHMLRVSSLDYAMHNDAMLSNWEEIIAKYMEPSMQQLLNNDITGKSCGTNSKRSGRSFKRN